MAQPARSAFLIEILFFFPVLLSTTSRFGTFTSFARFDCHLGQGMRFVVVFEILPFSYRDWIRGLVTVLYYRKRGSASYIIGSAEALPILCVRYFR